MADKFIFSLMNQLSNTLPGEKSHQVMKIKLNNDLNIEPTLKRYASVLICLFPNNDNWSFFLTKRSNSVEHHKGQISLPGGMIEKGENPINAALRETNEEIGVQIKKVQIIGKLSSIYIPVSNFKVQPFVGFLNKKPKTDINKQEVSRIFDVDLNDLMNDKNIKSEEKVLGNKLVEISYFSLKNEKIWGATSLILSEFKDVLKRII